MGDTLVGVQFGIANPDDILKNSVVEVTTDKTYQSSQAVANGVFDSRFGVIENGKICPTCKQSNQHCPGHFGHIRLARPVYLYQFFDAAEKLANVICLTCSKLLVTDAALESVTSTGMARFKDVRDLMPAGPKRPQACEHCKSPTFKKIAKVVGRAATLEGQAWDRQGVPPETPLPLQIELVLRAFRRITDQDCSRLGFNPKYARPEWMICTVLAVPPLTVRPSVVMDDNQRMEDDLTHKLIDILRNNQRLRDRIDKGDSIEMIDKCTAVLQYDVATYVDNDIKGMAPAAQRSGRPLRTLKSRFGAKTGRVRGNLMGKRVDYSARSVITPDANIDLDELGVPQEIAINLTFPEIVSIYNRDRLIAAVANGPDKHPGAKTVYLKEDNRTVSLRYVASDTINLREGDIVHRHLIDGDIVLFNRQPSLHKASMMAHRVIVLPYSTFRLNVSATRPYNADFDGDEMNMHVPQSIAAATELRYLASVLRNIISPRTNSPIIQLFQDTMTGIYRMSHPSVEIPELLALNMLSKIKRPVLRKNRAWTGAEVISYAFPLMNFKGGITLENGSLTNGIINKASLGSASKGLIHVVYNAFGPERTGQLINDIQSIVTQFNLYKGFSVGASDLIANAETNAFVNTKIDAARKKVADILSDVHSGNFENISSMSDGDDLEDKISSALKEVAAQINEQVLKSLSSENRIVQMVKSGSKGSEQNITQMVALLGQQLIEGRRVQYTLQDRTLPHFACYDDGIESRGFVQNSFVSGLQPAEFFYHAQAGREGLIDTAVKTSDTGYIQRRLMKIMEDQHVDYSGSVRNVTDSIIQFTYGEDGVDTVCIESQSCDLGLMTMEAVYRTFALSPTDVNPFLKEAVTECPDMVDEILHDRDLLVQNVFRYRKMDTLQAPVNIRRLIESYANAYATKTDLTPQHVVEGINGFVTRHPKNLVFHALLRFNLAPKMSILIHRFTEELFDELMRDIEFRYVKALCHAGEMVGPLAAQSIGEPTTQLTLNSIAHNERVWVKFGFSIKSVKIGDFIQEWISKSEKIESHPNNTTLAYMPAGWETMSVDETGKIEWRTLEAVTQHPPINEDGSNTLVKIHTKGGRTVLATKAKSFLTKGPDGTLVPTRGDELTIGCHVPVAATTVPNDTITFLTPEEEAYERTNDVVWDTVMSIEEQACPTPFVYDFTVEGTRNFVHANGLCLRDTFHSAGTVKANATSGVPRIEELLSASQNPKRPGNTAYLSGAASQNDAIELKKKVQRTTVRDITRSFRIYYDPYPLSASTSIDEDRELLETYERFREGDECTSPWIVRIELNEAEMVSRTIMDITEIAAKLHANSGLKMVKCISGTAGGKLVLRLSFDRTTLKNPTQLRFLEEKILDTVLTGIDNIGRVHIRTVKSELTYDSVIAGYVCKEQYVLDLEGTNLHDLMVFPGIDGTRVLSNDIHEINKVFGIEAARLALYEEINEVFATEKVNYHHLSVLVDSMTVSGRIVPVNRFGMNKNETGVLAKSSFEETSRIMFNAALGAEFDPMRGVSANIMFGQKPPCGTGFVDILVDETNLPEGPDSLEDEGGVLAEVNRELGGAPDSECRIEDILMPW
jgi:DNA-directed RNA polymerase beta' subunit